MGFEWKKKQAKPTVDEILAEPTPAPEAAPEPVPLVPLLEGLTPPSQSRVDKAFDTIVAEEEPVRTVSIPSKPVSGEENPGGETVREAEQPYIDQDLVAFARSLQSMPKIDLIDRAAMVFRELLSRNL